MFSRIAKKGLPGIAAIAIAVVSVGSGTAAHAESISLNTYHGSGWVVERLAPLPVVTSQSAAGAGAFGVFDIAAPNGAWISAANTAFTLTGAPSDTAAKWVGADTDGVVGTDTNGQQYVYTKSFSFLDPSPSDVTLNAVFSTDNSIAFVFFNGVDVTSSISVPGSAFIPGNLFEGTFKLALSLTTTTLSPTMNPHLLQIVTVNSHQIVGNGLDPGPAGLILSGYADATVVPVPPAVLAVGFAMLASFIYRMRKNRAAAI